MRQTFWYLIFAAVAIGTSPLARANGWAAASTVHLGVQDERHLSSFADVAYLDQYGQVAAHEDIFLSGSHRIIEDENAYMAYYSFNSVDPAEYRNTLYGVSVPGHCYWAEVDLIAYNSVVAESTVTFTSGSPYCIPAQPQCQLTVSAGGGGELSQNPSGAYDCGSAFTLTAQPAEGYLFVSWSGDVSSTNPTISFTLSHDMTLYANFAVDSYYGNGDGGTDNNCGGQISGQCSPIVINFEAGEYRLTGRDSPVLFDIAATGTARLIGWTAEGADEAFLWLDRDHDGLVGSGAELFGTATSLRSGYPAPNGFVALSEFDDNKDGVIDESDAIWPQLMLWRDLNHDAISQPSEISFVSESALRAIKLRYHWSGRRDRWGNTLRFESFLSLVGGGGKLVARPVYDVFFVPVN